MPGEDLVTYDASSLVAEDHREQTLLKQRKYRIDNEDCTRRHTSGSLPLRVYSSVWQIPAEIHD